MVFFNTIMRISKLYQKVIKFMIANLIFFEIFFSLLSWWQYIFICLAVGLRVLDVVVASVWLYVVLLYAPFPAPDFC